MRSCLSQYLLFNSLIISITTYINGDYCDPTCYFMIIDFYWFTWVEFIPTAVYEWEWWAYFLNVFCQQECSDLLSWIAFNFSRNPHSLPPFAQSTCRFLSLACQEDIVITHLLQWLWILCTSAERSNISLIQGFLPVAFQLYPEDSATPVTLLAWNRHVRLQREADHWSFQCNEASTVKEEKHLLIPI